jgi:hypothetical protein
MTFDMFETNTSNFNISIRKSLDDIDSFPYQTWRIWQFQDNLGRTQRSLKEVIFLSNVVDEKTILGTIIDPQDAVDCIHAIAIDEKFIFRKLLI